MRRTTKLAELCTFALLALLLTATAAVASGDAADGHAMVPAQEQKTVVEDVREVERSTMDGAQDMETPAAAERVDQSESNRAGRTWQFYSRESCYDMFTSSCYQSYFPAPFCPPNPQGKACSGFPYRCFVIINSAWADEYLCRP